MRPRLPFARWLGHLRVSRKLMLIYVLDLTAVIFVSAILVEEKYLAIDFARKELQGQRMLAPVRDALLAVAFSPDPRDDGPSLEPHADAIRRAQRDEGDGLSTDAPASAFAEAIVARPLQRAVAFEAGRALLTRIANQSNLILDPDLDSYYTMSLALLRYPELLEVMVLVAALQDKDPPVDATARWERLVGRIDAAMHGIGADHGEAIAAGDAALRERLDPAHRALAAGLASYRAAVARAAAGGGGVPDEVRRRVGAELEAAWTLASSELGRLLEARIERLFARMWLHMGTALALLLAILSVVTIVARQIAVPLRHLADVADRVRLTGDPLLRASWDSHDEIGRLVAAFNDMLERLDVQRRDQQDLAARAGAAQAQRELLEAIPIPLVVTAIPDHAVLHANEPSRRWIDGGGADPWAGGLEAGQRSRFFQRLADTGVVEEFEVRWRGASGDAWAVLSARRLRYQDRDAVLVTFTPINLLKQLEQRLALWAKVFEASSEGIVIMTADRRIVSVNRAFCRSTGFGIEDLVGEPLDALVDDGSRAAGALPSAASIRDAWQGEVAMRRQGGGTYPAWLLLSPVRDAASTPSHWIGLSVDVTDRRRTERRIEFLAHHDVLTELPNRAVCIERLRAAIGRPRPPGDRVAVLFVDLDRFKLVNDIHGHAVGDGLLREVATRLKAVLRESDTVARVGGDEFVVLIDGYDDDEALVGLVERRLLKAMAEPCRIDGVAVHASCSIGVATWPRDGDDVETLMRHADAAMYVAKASGRNAARWFSPEITERIHRRARLESRLRDAWTRGEMALHYQPRIDARTGAIVCVEGLLRWVHPELGSVPPAQFVPVAEESGLIRPMGRWVVERACAQQAAWAAEGLGRVPISINLSSLQLGDAGLPDFISACLSRWAVPPGTLEFEVTESVLMDDASGTLETLRAFRALGLRLSIDDFGTGWSSLSYLKRFPIDKLKIDRSYVHDMLGDPTDLAIVRAMLALGHALGLEVVAEGVETVEQAAVLRAEGCDELQGWLFAPAEPADALAVRLRAAGQPNGRTPISEACSQNANAAQAATPTTTAIASRDAGPAT